MRALIVILLAATASMPAAAAVAEGPYRTARPVSDEVLDTMAATALPAFARNARSLSDGDAQLFLQQVGVGSRIAMDNWWAQTGAALIFNNLIAPPNAR